jgi:D-tyrosyl-tRNA(Tyr) deacylase
VKAVVQRVASATVTAEGRTVGEIGTGFLVLLGVSHDDTSRTARVMADKVTGLRLFEDLAGKMNLALADVGGSVLCVSQFTLYGDLRRGRRPSFAAAAPPVQARELYEAFCEAVEAAGLPCARGAFGQHMRVELVNDGPVTIVVDSAELERARRA